MNDPSLQQKTNYSSRRNEIYILQEFKKWLILYCTFPFLFQLFVGIFCWLHFCSEFWSRGGENKLTTLEDDY